MKPAHMPSRARLAAIGLLVACMTPPPPATYVAPDYGRLEIRRVAVLPVVDRRIDRSFEADFDRELQDQAREQLEDKGYEAIVFRVFSGDGTITPSRVAEMEDDELAALVPEGFDAAALIFIDDTLSQYRVLFYRFRIEATGVLVSRTRGGVWSGRGPGAWGDWGLLSGVAMGVERGVAYRICMLQVFSSLPERD